MMSLQGGVFGGGLGVAIVAIVMANAAFRRHRVTHERSLQAVSALRVGTGFRVEPVA